MNDNIYTILMHRNAEGNYEKIPLVAKIPSSELDDINSQIEEIQKSLRNETKLRLVSKTEHDIQRHAACCDTCGLCVVCAGKHYTYSSWPPGGDRCFCNFVKKGKPIKEKPCSLCEEHDLMLRQFKRDKAQGFSRESKFKNLLNGLIVQRRQLYKKYLINPKVITE